jgi:hypothetical protein
VKRTIVVLLAVAAFAAAAAGAARADGGWCGQAEGTCDTSATYIHCSDGSVWVLDSSSTADDLGETLCDGDWTLLQPPAPDDSSSNDGSFAQLGLDTAVSPGMAPDPTQYSGEVVCPDGSIWAVAIGDDFICPAA